MELTSRHLVHLFKCWFVADAPTGNADSSSSFFIKTQWNKHSPHNSSFLSCNLLTQGIVITSLMTAEATQQQHHSYPWCFWMAPETKEYLGPHPAERCCGDLCRHRESPAGWDRCMDPKAPSRDLCWKDGLALGRLRFWFLALLFSVVAPAGWISTPWSQLSLHSFAKVFISCRYHFALCEHLWPW